MEVAKSPEGADWEYFEWGLNVVEVVEVSLQHQFLKVGLQSLPTVYFPLEVNLFPPRF